MDTTPALDLTDLKRVQEVLGTLLYYACAVNSTMLPAIGSLATQNAKPTPLPATMKASTQGRPFRRQQHDFLQVYTTVNQ